MVNWADIHPDFAEKERSWIGDDRKTYQQRWEERDITYQDAQEWIPLGFKPKDYLAVKQWKNHNFTSQQTQSWIKIGLNIYEYEFATYLRGKNHQPNQTLNLNQLRKEFNTWKYESKPAQEYLDIIYPKDQRNTIERLYIGDMNLTGSLDCSDFVNLEELNCSDNQLTTLNITNCLKLKKLDCSKNNLTDLIFPASAAEQLTILNIGNNNLSDLSLFSHLVNLERLYIYSGYNGYNQNKIQQDIYNHFTGSLKPLQKLTKLKTLDIEILM